MTGKRFSLRARVSTETPDAVGPILGQLVPGGSVQRSQEPKEFLVEGELEGPSAKDLNRALLSALRRTEKRTRLRAEWTREGTTERFFDYVPKGVRKASSNPPTRP
ncbi:MAG: hypothetical protein WB789_01940 [Thermoplasmata archaeon]|jgi:hypothetical protein